MRLFDYEYDRILVEYCLYYRRWNVVGVYPDGTHCILCWERTRREATITAREIAFALDYENHSAFSVHVRTKAGDAARCYVAPHPDGKYAFARLPELHQRHLLYGTKL